MAKQAESTFTKNAKAYARAVKAGKISACWQVKAAAERFLADFTRKDIDYRDDRATHACSFIEQLPHVVGPLAGIKIKLEPFQVFIIVNLFGWVEKATGLRRYREAFILLPRGNAKSTLAAAIALYMTFAQNQAGAEGLSGATSMDQANAVFGPAKRMVEMTPALGEALGIETAARSIYQVTSGSKFVPVIAKTRDGGLPWVAICDELHQALDDTQLSAFRTGMGKRRGADPLLVIISTAGTNVAGVCRQEQLYFEQVLKGTIADDSKFVLVYTIDKTDDWKDFRVWRKANPCWGVSVDEEHLKREHAKALQSPSYQAIACTKYLNVWTNTASGWLNQKDWAAAARPDLVIDSGARAWIGVDLSTKTDITAVAMVAEVDGARAIVPFLFLPTGALERSKNTKAYAEWVATGALIQTDGSASDHEAVETKVRELCSTYNVQDVLFDGWQSAGMMQRLMADGIACAEFPQRASHFTAPMVDFEADLMNGKIVHPDNPALNWMAANASVAQRGPFRSLTKPTGQDHLKIDGIVSAMMAYAQAIRDVPAPPSAPMLSFV